MQSTQVFTYTGPSCGPPSINDGDDIKKSTDAVLADAAVYSHVDGILVACFSHHPLVAALQKQENGESNHPRAVTGIFEASILTALSLVRPQEKWGIVTTGKFWEQHLTDGVNAFLGVNSLGTGTNASSKFAGVESTGLNASDFHHGVDPEVVTERLKGATRRLLAKGNVTCVVMGCAGMTGLEDIIRRAAMDELGEDFAYRELHVIDGVRAGIIQVDQMIKLGRLRRH
jgi:Asp/Glu/hydantoin racemase